MVDAAQFDPPAAAEFVPRHFGPPSVMLFANGAAKHPALPTTDATRDFIAAHPEADLYFALADRKNAKAGKLGKADCEGARWAWVDMDPPKGVTDPAALAEWRAATLARIDGGDVPPPHVIINSGRGLWALWRLTRRVPADEAEAINYALAKTLGGDHCHNIDRVARVPFTRNSKTGEVAVLLRDDPDAISPERLPKQQPPGATGGEVAAPPPRVGSRLASLDDLSRWGVPARVRVILNHGHHPDEPKEGDNSRSAWLFDAVCQLARCEVPDDTIMAILTDPSWGISASILDKGANGERYAGVRLNGRERPSPPKRRSSRSTTRTSPMPTSTISAWRWPGWA